MFFVVSKVLGFLALPSNVCMVAGLAGLLLWLLSFSRLGPALVVLSLLAIATLGWSPLGNALILPLEERFPSAELKEAPAGIIVLGGALDTVISHARGEVALNEAGERMTATAELARRHPQARIVFSGGSGNLLIEGASESDLAQRLFAAFGIPAERIAFENRSRNTAENARFSAELLRPTPDQEWLLLTSAYHMPRAIGAFRKAGFVVRAYPVDYRTRGWQDFLRPFPSLGEGLRRTDSAVREWVGLIVYWLTGRTTALFPQP